MTWEKCKKCGGTGHKAIVTAGEEPQQACMACLGHGALLPVMVVVVDIVAASAVASSMVDQGYVVAAATPVPAQRPMVMLLFTQLRQPRMHTKGALA